MEMEKKNIAIIILAVFLVTSAIGNIILAIPTATKKVKGTDNVIFGTQVAPRRMDPQNSYDSGSSDVVTQWAEQLYDFNASDPDFKLQPTLATALPVLDLSNPDQPLVNITLRQNVTFHDGMPFNASCVKWSFDRLNHFLNYSGNSYLPAPFNVPVAERTLLRGLYSFGGKPIINETIVVSEFQVTLKLNIPKASIFVLLAFAGSSILSPHSTPANRFLDYGLKDIPIGTGPYKFASYRTDIELRLEAFDDYWGLTDPKYDLKTEFITFAIYSDDITMCEALLAGDIDIIDAPNPTYLDTFEEDSDIVLLRGGPNINTEYVAMNPLRVNLTWRKAISYAIDYEYVVEVVMENQAYRLASPIPTGIWAANYSLNYPTFNVSLARTIINNDLGTSYDINDDTLWAGLNLGSFHMVVQDDSDERQKYTDYVCNVVGPRIGLDIVRYTTTFEELVYEGIVYGHDHPTEEIWPGVYMDLWAIGWAPDYLDPENYVNEFWSSESALNVGYNNTYLDELLDNASIALPADGPVREAMYDEIQTILIEQDFAFAWLFTGRNNDAWLKGLNGWMGWADNLQEIGSLDLTRLYY
ncbi:MAG: ABC transporter substrate-binding protein [Candidatus Odinarchaeota archaeon]